MSTNATITVEDNGKFYTNYVHWDGYVSGGVGEALVTHWNDLEKALQLVQDVPGIRTLGDIDNDSVEFFKEDISSTVYDDYEDLLEHYGQEFNYLFTDAGSEDGQPRWIWDKGEVADELY